MTDRLIRRVSAFCLIQPRTVRETFVSPKSSRNQVTRMRESRYILCWALGLALALPILSTQAGKAVPVFVWGGDSSAIHLTSVNPFQKTSQSEFEEILKKIVGGSQNPVLVNVRDSLCAEDFILHQKSLEHLKDGDSWVYLPSVDNPLSVFENFTSYNRTIGDELESVSNGQLIITKGVDLDAVWETYNMVKESSPNLVAALIGSTCIWNPVERTRRAVEETPLAQTTGYLVETQRILLYASSPPVLTISEDKSIVATLIGNVTEEGNGTAEAPLQLNFKYSVVNGSTTFDANVLLRFVVKTAGYYSGEVVYQTGEKTTPLQTRVDFVFPNNFSYHCTQVIRFGNASFAVFNVTGLQVQIDSKNFSDAYDCVGFTSIPIWAGIFVSAIFATIMIWGMTMILDIRTMDRFDDPKGKTITISASE